MLFNKIIRLDHRVPPYLRDEINVRVRPYPAARAAAVGGNGNKGGDDVLHDSHADTVTRTTNSGSADGGGGGSDA